MTLSREPNTYNSGNLREYLRLWLGNQTHIYGQSKYPSIQYMYTCDSLRFFNSIHNTQVNLSVTHRRSPFTPFAFLPFATRSVDKSTSTRLTPSTSLLFSWFSREVLTCIHLEGIVVSYTFDFYLHNLWCRQRYSEDRRTARSVYVKRVKLTLGASQSVAKTRRVTQRSQI